MLKWFLSFALPPRLQEGHEVACAAEVKAARQLPRQPSHEEVRRLVVRLVPDVPAAVVAGEWPEHVDVELPGRKRTRLTCRLRRQQTLHPQPLTTPTPQSSISWMKRQERRP